MYFYLNNQNIVGKTSVKTTQNIEKTPKSSHSPALLSNNTIDIVNLRRILGSNKSKAESKNKTISKAETNKTYDSKLKSEEIKLLNENKKNEDDEIVNYGENHVNLIKEKFENLETNLKKFENNIKEIKENSILRSETQNSYKTEQSNEKISVLSSEKVIFTLPDKNVSRESKRQKISINSKISEKVDKIPTPKNQESSSKIEISPRKISADTIENQNKLIEIAKLPEEEKIIKTPILTQKTPENIVTLQKLLKNPNIPDKIDEDVKESMEFIDNENYHKNMNKKITVRDSHPAEDFEENNGNLAQEIAKQLAENVITTKVKKIIKAIRNYAFRKKIYARIKEKQHLKEISKKQAENTGILPINSQKSNIDSSQNQIIIQKKHNVPVSSGSLVEMQNRIKDKAALVNVRNNFKKLRNKYAVLWARKIMEEYRNKLLTNIKK